MSVPGGVVAGAQHGGTKNGLGVHSLDAHNAQCTSGHVLGQLHGPHGSGLGPLNLSNEEDLVAHLQSKHKKTLGKQPKGQFITYADGVGELCARCICVLS
jgi:hypothetical protein